MKPIAALLLFGSLLFAGQNVLIVADEFPAMKTLAAKLERGAKAKCTLVEQTAIPADLKPFSTLIVYIHKNIGEPAEKRFIEFAESGGKLILLHHSISSGKRRNQFWFPFLKIELPAGSAANSGYAYYDPVAMEVVNLAPKHYITTHKVKYPAKTVYKSSDAGGAEKQYPAVELQKTEAYINHVFKGERTILLGMKFREPKSGTVYMQDRAGWLMKAGKGTVMYFMAGHSARDFENPAYGQMVVNAVAFKTK